MINFTKSNKKTHGFTIIELIVIILVIGILAAVGVVSYGSWKTSIITTQLKSDLNGVAAAMENARNFGNGYPSTIPSTFIPSSGVTLSGGGLNSGANYCVDATNNNQSYRITNKNIAKLGVCSDPQRDRLSVIKWTSWALGTGSVTGYSANGTSNSRIINTNPWGVSDIVWDSYGYDATGPNGGWNGNFFPIDNTKMYRFSTWVRRKTIGNGPFYFGTSGGGASVLNRSDAAVNGNPYFSATGWWGNANQWYLVVGYVWPAGSGIGATMSETGIYALDGTKVQAGSDFIWQPTTTSSNHRSYLYYSGDPTTNQQWYQPRVDVVDGTEPTISELLNNIF